MKTRAWISGIAVSITTVALTAYAASTFGFRGLDGSDGANGADGLDRPDATYFATGASDFINLRGGDGLAGINGEYGGSASSCHYTEDANDYEGADGGNGGDGGDGGDAGNGGDLKLFYTNPSDLARLAINTSPGLRGLGGNGGPGGTPCTCMLSQWYITDASGNRRTYTCKDGKPGTAGKKGSDGFSGFYGDIYLINQAPPLPPVETSKSLTINQLVVTPIHTLTRYSWLSKTGARQIFGYPSDVRDSYYQYNGVRSKTIKVSWTADRPMSDVADKAVSIRINSKDTPEVLFNSSLWGQQKSFFGSSVDAQTIQILRALTPAEAAAGRLKAIQGRGKDAVAILEWDFGKSVMPDTQGMFAEFRNLKVESYEGNRWVRVYNKDDPYYTNFKDYDPGTKILLGKLIDKKYLAAGKKLRISATVELTLPQTRMPPYIATYSGGFFNGTTKWNRNPNYDTRQRATASFTQELTVQ